MNSSSVSTNKSGFCYDHSGNCEAIGSTKKEVDKIWLQIDKVNKSIDGIKTWIIAGMGSIILQGAIALIKYLTTPGVLK